MKYPAFLLAATTLAGALAAVLPAATLPVDQRGGTPYPTIASAVAAVQAGDTILLVSGSGPYRENIKIMKSGTAGAPIIFDGNDELVTGFDPFVFTYNSGTAQWEYVLPAPIPNTSGSTATPFRQLIVYNGQRLVIDAASGRLTSDYASLSADGLKLILNSASGASPTIGWEIAASRTASIGVVNIGSAYSYQTFRNLRISGSQNDGFSLKGTGTNLKFENIEAFHNFDEGFSAHSSTHSEIDGGIFWGNDNGIYNETTTTVACILRNVQAYANLGFGIGMTGGTNEVHNVQCWDNGIQNLSLGGIVTGETITTYENRWATRPWVSYNETQAYQVNRERPYAYYQASGTTFTGTPPTVLSASQLPPLLVPYDDWRYIYFTAAQVADPNVSGQTADPDADGCNNLTEYQDGTNPLAVDVSSVTIVATDASASENGDTGAFTITRSGSTAQALTVSYAVAGSATAGSDYAALTGSITLPVGAASGTVTITPQSDGSDESSETVVLTLAAQSGYALGSPASATVTIANVPMISVTVQDGYADETGTNTGRFRVTRSGSISAALSVNVTLSGAAINGTDYTLVTSPVTIPAGASYVFVTISPLYDGLSEASESVVLQVQSSTGYGIDAAHASASFTLTNTP